MANKADYELVAAVVNEQLDIWRSTAPRRDGMSAEDVRVACAAIRILARTLAIKFKVENKHFDRARFLYACGIEDDVEARATMLTCHKCRHQQAKRAPCAHCGAPEEYVYM